MCFSRAPRGISKTCTWEATKSKATVRGRAPVPLCMQQHRSHHAEVEGFGLDGGIKEEERRPECPIDTGQQRQVGVQDRRVLQGRSHKAFQNTVNIAQGTYVLHKRKAQVRLRQ